MTKITSHIADPSWWFTVFFVGIVVSVIAGFAKDYVQAIASKFFSGMRGKQEIRSQQREVLLIALADNEGFLIFSLVRCVLRLVLSSAFLIFFISSPTLFVSLASLCRGLESTVMCLSQMRQPYAAIAIYFLSGLLAAFTMFRSARMIQIVMLGFGRYRKKRGLPALR